ncbi:ATP-dependent DNA ligase [Clostridium estertheticum]|uniref:ATP-dependent DNA ligase n=1 Tax=Clostridium estertheticum TaxID=238834 RepID=UPI001C0D2A2B|nr:RNA ligase family protein [Clostridium estertheticum]MBU3171740.1 DNA ligase [Clostridium estertheticum]
MDIFENKNIKPMLIGENQEAFDSPDYIYELKLDGERCIAYLDKDVTELRNKRNMKMLAKVPELSKIHKQVKHRCILDGELIIIRDGVPDFYEIRRRSLMSNTFKIQLASSKLPASFTAFDILYYDDHSVTDLPLMQRKKLLEKVIKENERIAISRYIEEQGIKFYQLAKQNNLEGIVAKRKDSKYYLDKKTKDWIKIKYLLDDDFVICGYIHKDGGVISIVLGQYLNKELVYKGHVTLGLSTEDFQLIKATPQLSTQPFNELPSGNDNAVWILPRLVCIVKFMMKTANGGLRQPIFKGIREDKSPKDCTI